MEGGRGRKIFDDGGGRTHPATARPWGGLREEGTLDAEGGRGVELPTLAERRAAELEGRDNRKQPCPRIVSPGPSGPPSNVTMGGFCWRDER